MECRSVKYVSFVVLVGLFCSLFVLPRAVDAKEWPSVSIVFSDIPAMDTIPIQAAVLKLRERGIPVKSHYFKSDQLANQAVVGGQVDLGSGTPYGIIQRLNKQEKKTEIRFFLQRSILEYVPVVRKSRYKSWKDLDGKEIVVHSRASGTEAQARMAEKLYGIKFSKVKYVPGTEVRGNAMMQGKMDASIIGLFTTNMLMERQPGEWLVLPLRGVSATDDALYGRKDWLEKNQAVVREIIKEILNMYRRCMADASYAGELFKQYSLMPDLPPEIVKQIPTYWKTVALRGLRSVNGGGEAAAKTDLNFFHIAGQLKGRVEDLKVEDFWYLKPLNDVLDEIGRVNIDYQE